MERIRIESFLPYLTLIKQMKPNSLRLITGRSAIINKWFDGRPLTQDLFEDFLMEKKAQGLKQTSVSSYQLVWNNFVDFLAYKNIPHELKKIPIPHSHKKVGIILTPDEVTRLINTKLEYGKYAGRDSSILDVRYRTGIKLLYYCGLRFGELAKLHIKDIDFEAKRAFLTETKTDEPRVIWLTPTLSQELSDLCVGRDQNDYVFTTMADHIMLPQMFNDELKRRAIKAGITKNVHPHMLRRSFASTLRKEGKQDVALIAKALGHKDIQTTYDNYLWFVDDDIEQGVNTLPARAAELDPIEFITLCAGEFEKRLTQNKRIFYNISRSENGFQLIVSRK